MIGSSAEALNRRVSSEVGRLRAAEEGDRIGFTYSPASQGFGLDPEKLLHVSLKNPSIGLPSGYQYDSALKIR